MPTTTPLALPDPNVEPTVSLDRAYAVLGMGRTTAYTDARTTGELAGIRLIRVGRKYRVPTRELLRVLGVRVE